MGVAMESLSFGSEALHEAKDFVEDTLKESLYKGNGICAKLDGSDPFWKKK